MNLISLLDVLEDELERAQTFPLPQSLIDKEKCLTS